MRIFIAPPDLPNLVGIVMPKVEARLRDETELSGGIVAAEMRRRIIDGPKTGRMYGSHQASAPGEAPANWTGKLVDSIWEGMQNGFAYVRVDAKYAGWLEWGTRKMAPRPFITPSVEKQRRKIIERYAKALAQAIRDAKK